jgi:hypothetical protein
MTPLTHAAVGLAICHRVNSRAPGVLGWALALGLAFSSHFLLDSIPHLDAIGPLREFRRGMALHLALALLGTVLAALLYRRNREAGLIWLLLSVWVGIAGISGTLVRALTAIVLMVVLAFRMRRIDAPAFLFAAILAVSGDMIPGRLESLDKFHDAMHFVAGWGTSLYIQFEALPPPPTSVRLRNPYFQFGYALELLVEAAIFLTAIWSFSRLSLDGRGIAKNELPAEETEEKPAPV